MREFTLEQKQAVRNLAANMFAEDISNAEIARRLCTKRQTVSGWHKIWREQGVDGLVLGKPGPKPRLTKEQLEEITSDLLLGPMEHGYDTQFWTLDRIAAFIEKKTGVAYHRCHVWYLLSNMNWSCQKPERQAKARNEAAIAYWKEHDWPRIKRGRKRPAQP
jgi:transposase